jgi:D-alanine-D-alanine ligase-like ATP-grasp enzyme
MSDTGFALKGYEDLEISSQIIIRDALNRGIDVDILDRKANFFRLCKNGKTEYVKQATKTSKDSYISFLIMENKSVSKQLLQESGLPVPEGRTFADPGQALQFSRAIPGKKIVIKPATTNFGIGITIMDIDRKTAAVESAIANAFSFAETIIVEDFVAGSEYRFLVVDFETIAVCKRVPANILGDGIKTIERLVGEKNRDPRRGEGHVTPLEKIQLGETEKNVLREDYGFGYDTVPRAGEVVYLRRNSNVSTGGDSIDVTDTTDSSYKQIAQKAARVVDARICGVDMILTSPDSKGDYAILELNFNPVLYIHNYPYQGKNRHVGEKILDLFGF